MITEHTSESLAAFAAEVAARFNAGDIRAPIHLDGGNEEWLVEAFKNVHQDDWVCGSWRMMSKCLLKGVPASELMAAVMAGKSISLCFPEYRVISSAIVGGIIPIAVGLAMSIKRNATTNRVHCFVGDMTATTGIYNECVRYAAGHGLPIRFVVEDNRKSVGTPTAAAWGSDEIAYESAWLDELEINADIQVYEYSPQYPHSGAGKRVNF